MKISHSIKLIFLGLISTMIVILWNHKTTKHPIPQKANDPNGLIEWRSKMRNYDHDPETVLEVRKALRKQLKNAKATKDAGIGSWESLGPEHLGGRIRAIALHPTDEQVIFVGGVSGGIWKSTDKGQNWTPKSDFNPSLAVTSIIIKPSNPDIMYASTGEGIVVSSAWDGTQGQALPGAGILKSIDGGESWDLISAIDNSNYQEFYWVNKIAFSPNNDDIFYAVTSARNVNGGTPNDTRGALWKFTAEATLVQRLFSSEDAAEFIDIDFSLPTQSFFIGCGNDALHLNPDPNSDTLILNRALRNIDPNNDNGFANWTGRVEMAVSQSHPAVIYALSESNFGTVYRSNDFGVSWAKKDMIDVETNNDAFIFKPLSFGSSSQGWYDNAIWVDPFNPDHLLLGGIDLWRSTDGGHTLEKISQQANFDFGQGRSPHVDQHIIVESADYDVNSRTVYVGNDGGIVRADNYLNVTDSTGWTMLNNNLSITQLYASDVDDDGNYMAGAQDNGTSIFKNGNWAYQYHSDGGYCAYGNSDTLYFSRQNGSFRIQNQADEIQILNLLPNNPDFIAPMKVFPFNRNRILMGDESLWFTDEPQEWSNTNSYFTDVSPAARITGETITAIEIGTTAKVVVGYTDGRIYRANFANTNNPSWTRIDGSLFTDRVITDIAINPIDPNKIAISLGGYYNENVYISFDNGATWNSKSDDLLPVHINSLIWHLEKSEWLYAGTDLGLFNSEDNGNSWNVTPSVAGFSDGPVFTEITNLQWGPKAVTEQAHLYVTTYGRGMWRTEYDVYADLWLDENHPSPVGNGTVFTPFKNINDLATRQAHGQTWHIDKGNYPINSAILLDKRLDELLITNSTAPAGSTNSVILGEN